MKSVVSAPLLRQMRAIFEEGASAGLSDAALLERFAHERGEAGEAAFASLVERHGPMVLRVCRGVLREPHDVHDAFQATFLVLLRKADSLRVRDSLGPWLHGVAFRVSAKARVAAARRRVNELRTAVSAESDRGGVDSDLAATVHEEVEKLPPKYRSPIVLCYLEGLTHEGAAETLGWPVGTVRGRLARARELLRGRLARRGLAPSAAAIVGAWETGEASAASLAEPLVRSVLALAAARSSGAVPASVTALAEGIGATAKLKIVAILVAAAAASFGLVRTARNDGTPAAPKPTPSLSVARAESDQPKTWPSDVDIRGRVVDHRGEPVKSARIVILGHEKLTVFGDVVGRATRYALSTGTPGLNPTEATTDDDGRFTVRRSGSPADRIAVVCDATPFWEVFRSQSTANDVLIRLPEPAALTLRTDVPGKPATAEYWITARPPGRADWASDSLFLRSVKGPNPGDRVVGPLPPGNYAVERMEFTPTGKSSNLMTPCDRRLLKLQPGEQAVSTFDRKEGRAVEGRVTGVEGVRTRTALLTIGYFGPEERLEPDSKPIRQGTHVDVVPIGADGRFTTPPLPPNRYDFVFSAYLAATPDESGGPYDFYASKSVEVTREGSAPIEIVVKPKAPALSPAAPRPGEPRLEVRARDESGAPVKDFEILAYAPPRHALDAVGVDGRAVLAGARLANWSHGELVVSAPGYVSSFVDLGPIEGLRTVDVRMERGEKIRLRVRDASGKPIPQAIMPLAQVYPARVRREVWNTLSERDPESRARSVALLNFLGVRREPVGDFSFHVGKDRSESIYFAFSHPDLYSHYESSPASASALGSGVWDVVLPAPASLEVALTPGEKSPFAGARFFLTPVFPGPSGPVPALESGELIPPVWRTTLDRLAPGSYDLNLATMPVEPAPPNAEFEARPGEYRARLRIELKPGERSTIRIDPPPLNPEAWRGSRSATIVVRPPGDRPLAGEEEYVVLYNPANYGPIVVAKGTLPKDGTIRLKKIAPGGPNPDVGFYTIRVAGEYLGQFRVEDRDEVRSFDFQAPVRVGDLAPDVVIPDLETGKPVRISEHRGKVVFLEFWATWCGPCREPMENLVALGERRSAAAADDAVLIAVGIDNDRDALRRRAPGKGVRRLWSPENPAGGAPPAHAEFGISGVPTAFLIDRSGRVVWRGHPSSIDVEAKIDELLKQ